MMEGDVLKLPMYLRRQADIATELASSYELAKLPGHSKVYTVTAQKFTELADRIDTALAMAAKAMDKQGSLDI
jgi:hypothetical protein